MKIALFALLYLTLTLVWLRKRDPFSFSFSVKRQSTTLSSVIHNTVNTQCAENLALRVEQSVCTLDCLCVPCYM